MKRVYLLILLAIISFVVLNARERVWLFGNGFTIPTDNSSSMLPAPELWNTVKLVAFDETSWTASLCSSSCTDALEVCKNYRLSAASKPDPDGVYGSFGGRIRLDGPNPAVSLPSLPVTSYLAFNVLGNTTIIIYCNPSDAVAKTLNVANSSGSLVGSTTSSAIATTSATNAEKLTINYSGAATKLTIYPTWTYSTGTSILNVYAIKVIDTATTSIDEASKIVLKKVGNQLLNENALAVEIFTVLGAKVLASSETSIDISGLASGVYIARTPTGSIKFIK